VSELLSLDLAHSVLTSRLSSCDRKSRRRPDRPATLDQAARLRYVGGEPIELLAPSGLDAIRSLPGKGGRRRSVRQDAEKQCDLAPPAAP